MTTEQAVQMALWAAAAPLIGALAVYLAMWWKPDRPRPGVKPAVAGVSAFALIYVVCHGLLVGWPAIPPREAMHWLPIAAIIGAALGCLDLAVPALRSRYVSAAIIVVFGVLLPRTVAMTGQAAWLSTALLIWSLVWCSLRVVATVPTRFVAVIVMGLLAACSAAMLAGSGSLKQGQLAGVIAFCTLGACVAQILRPGVVLTGPAIGVAAAVIATALGQGVAYGSTPTGAAMLIAGAGVAAIPASMVGTIKPSSWKRVVVVALIVLAIAGAGVVYAGLSSTSGSYEDYEAGT